MLNKTSKTKKKKGTMVKKTKNIKKKSILNTKTFQKNNAMNLLSGKAITNLDSIRNHAPTKGKRTNISSFQPVKLNMEMQNISFFQQIQKLIEERNEKDAIIANMKKKINPKRYRKSRKALSHFDFTCKRVAKKEIFPMVKFITNDKELHDCSNKGSIGYEFLAALKREDQVTKHAIVVLGNERTIWENAKSLVNTAIGEKRNARQTQMKKAFQGL